MNPYVRKRYMSLFCLVFVPSSYLPIPPSLIPSLLLPLPLGADWQTPLHRKRIRPMPPAVNGNLSPRAYGGHHQFHCNPPPICGEPHFSKPLRPSPLPFSPLSPSPLPSPALFCASSMVADSRKNQGAGRGTFRVATLEANSVSSKLLAAMSSSDRFIYIMTGIVVLSP